MRQRRSPSCLTQERLKNRLSYNPSTGVFTWLSCKDLWPSVNARQAGKAAGCLTPAGYILIRIDREMHLSHRLAWLYMVGTWPDEEIDHANLDKKDNRWVNLRAASYSENRTNCRMRLANRAGLKGIYFTKGAYQASIRVRGQSIYLGRFKKKEEAHAAYADAADRHYGAFARAE